MNVEEEGEFPERMLRNVGNDVGNIQKECGGRGNDLGIYRMNVEEDGEYTGGMLRKMGNDVVIYRRNAEEWGMMWESTEGMLRKGE